MALGPLRLRHQLYAAAKLEPHHCRDGDTISETCSSCAVQRGEQYVNC